MRCKTSRNLSTSGIRLAYIMLLSSCKITLASPVPSSPSCMTSTLSQPTPLASGLVVFGYYDGDIGRPVQVPYGKVLVTDNGRMLWGYCSEQLIAEDICRLAGACVDNQGCSGGCTVGAAPTTGLSTSMNGEEVPLLKCSSDPDSSICAAAIWILQDGPAFTSLGCEPTPITAHILEKPFHEIFIGLETPFPSEDPAQTGPSEGGLISLATSVLAEAGYEAAEATVTGDSENGTESYDSVEMSANSRKLETWQTDYPAPLPSTTAAPTLAESFPGSDPISEQSSPSPPRSEPSVTGVPITTTTSAAPEPVRGGGLVPGQVAGIVVGSMAGAAILALGALYITWRHLVTRFSMAMGSIYMTLSRPRPAPTSTAQSQTAGP
ncbi:uncharacterized protein PgNI_04380 [Pyricularia grisea]|uniref:Uncharacterized protein n=1 Tax=Pyricularia grisea TaxID=148305 RepID=A0A6P8BE93_PYRGI|nr:uncharacterized protein PgNI_04380 [Pyricularia grisea]TLD14201.1 hypothetical protein PgNI_04380 [Pyricularia grisea]